MNITETYKSSAEKWPEKTAIYDQNGRLNYREWDAAVSHAAEWLEGCEDTDNHCVGFLLGNNRSCLIMFAATAKIGWTAVPLDPRWARSELDAKVRLAGLKLIITEPAWTDKCSFTSVHIATAIEIQKTAIRSAMGYESKEDDQPFFFGFTSGSSGEPKGFERSQDSWVHSFDCNRRDLQWTSDERILVAGSLFNTHFLYAAVCGLYLGASVILLPAFSADICLRLMEKFLPSQIVVVPTMLESLLAEKRSWLGHFHWVCSGAKCAVATKINIASLFPNSLLDEFYGASELSFVTLCRQEENAPADSVGRPFFNVSVAIRGENNSWIQDNRPGEIYVRGPLLFDHYVTASGNTELPQIEGWVTVGDIGSLDPDGYLYIIGRKNGMINFGGLNIFPEEIENVLKNCPGVEHAAVLGLPDSHWGEVVVAFIQMKRRVHADKKRLKHECLRCLTPYKVPRLWFFPEKMPYTAGGKIDKQLLGRRHKEAANWKKQ
ncbi:AMP-binding protein [Sporolactobacillus sp. CQH2019]|uniref:AMP-binding protein n=2 Tax=unclassified Sporolactobacillus TaxID=2628533 RepID=UPI0023679044|nr:AMP-binding protein [Sporolactobacillus sp. CQH2019]MDD9150848.1 AMP-binding protein [Sporolactobacillus sp. CQH2019]